MKSLVITTPATDYSLLSIDEMREAAGVSDGSRDTELRALEARIADSITSECNVAVGVGYKPTLRQETLTETIYCPTGTYVMLSRRHEVSITSVTIDGTDTTEVVIEPESGILRRLSGNYPAVWCGSLAVIVYQAGFATVPGDLKQAAMDFYRGSLGEAGRDPYVKSEVKDIPGVGRHEVDYWVGNIPGRVSEGAVPAVVAGQLKRFRNTVIG